MPLRKRNPAQWGANVRTGCVSCCSGDKGAPIWWFHSGWREHFERERAGREAGGGGAGAAGNGGGGGGGGRSGGDGGARRRSEEDDDEEEDPEVLERIKRLKQMG